MIKYIISNNILEIYNYEFTKKGRGSSKGIYNRDSFSGITKTNNYNITKKNRRDTIRRLATINFNNKDSNFWTFTFKDDIKDIKIANNLFHKFIDRLKYYILTYTDFDIFKFKYLGVIEFQDTFGRGVIHYHCLINMPFIDKKILQDKIWKLGICYVTRINDIDNLGAYLIKYMSKDTNDIRLMGEKGYVYSLNLERPQEFQNFTEFYKNGGYRFKDCKPIYNSEYLTEHLGECKYSQYNLNRC